MIPMTVFSMPAAYEPTWEFRAQGGYVDSLGPVAWVSFSFGPASMGLHMNEEQLMSLERLLFEARSTLPHAEEVVL